MPELISLKVPDSIQEFPLIKDSVVFIVGGWMGAHAQYYVDNYDPNVHVFEPQFAMAKQLADKFESKRKVNVHGFGLGTESGELPMSRVGTDRCSFVNRLQGMDGNESAFEGPYETGRLMEVGEFLDMADIKKVDLCLINCEGCEFQLLLHLMNTGLIERFNYLMVQFHLHHEGAELMGIIRDRMENSHKIRDDYEPAWIVWELRKEEIPPKKRKAKKK